MAEKLSSLSSYTYRPRRRKELDDKVLSFPGISDSAFEIIKSTSQFPVRCYSTDNFMADAVRDMLFYKYITFLLLSHSRSWPRTLIY